MQVMLLILPVGMECVRQMLMMLPLSAERVAADDHDVSRWHGLGAADADEVACRHALAAAHAHDVACWRG